MATIQMKISINPRTGATVFTPRETNMIRIVPIVTSQMRAQKMKRGTATREKSSGSIPMALPIMYHDLIRW